MRTSAVFTAFLSAFVIFQSCSKEEVNNAPTLIQQSVTDIPADTIVGLVNGQPVGAGKFTFFSFEKNGVVASTDSNSTKWDIGLRGTTIITNGGNSGPGQAGAFVYVGTFDELKSVPADSVFRKDNAPASYAVPLGSNKGWYIYNGQVNLVTPIPGRVLVFKTATGKYAKLEIISYYKGGATLPASASDAEKRTKQRYFTFRYAYQGDGSVNFQ